MRVNSVLLLLLLFGESFLLFIIELGCGVILLWVYRRESGGLSVSGVVGSKLVGGNRRFCRLS